MKNIFYYKKRLSNGAQVGVLYHASGRINNDAKALGVYITLLIVQFRVRYSTDIPVLYREGGLLESRLKPYLPILLQDEKQMEEAVDAGEEFLKAFVAYSSLPELKRSWIALNGIFMERSKKHTRDTLTGPR